MKANWYKGSEIVVAHDLEDLCERAAVRVAQYITNRVQASGRAAIALSGGTTPRRLYERLATGKYGQAIPWGHVYLFWGDERCVPPDHPDSNYKMAYDTLISKIPIPKENVYRMPAERSDHVEAALEYEKRMRMFFGLSGDGWPRFDFVLLGIGADGHTASLFPGSSALAEKKQWVAATYIEKLKVYRLTLTPEVFNCSAQVIFMAAGKEKAPVMKDLFMVERRSNRYPFQEIRPHEGELIFFLDQAACSLSPPFCKVSG
ncbi:MAG: 6-phosphogluconolactonase [Nitrospirae bacterium]|nr:6-phosphogluconolactonase [Nitrospirota bacterium]